MVHVPSKCTQPIKMHPHQSTPLPLPQIFFSLYPLNQSFNFLLPTNTPILLIISYPMIYISSKTSDNSMSNCLFYALSCFAYNTPMTTAINMFLPPFESSYRPLSNYMCPVQMRPAVQNAMWILCWIQGIKYSSIQHSTWSKKIHTWISWWWLTHSAGDMISVIIYDDSMIQGYPHH